MKTISESTILILANNDVGLYKFRKELILELLKSGYRVYISLPEGEYVQAFVDLGCFYINTTINRRGTNPIQDFKLMSKYVQIIEEVRPDYVLTYTIKPNIYGGMAAARKRVPYIPNITGLGSAVESSKILNRFVIILYTFAFRRAQTVFFQNEDNMKFFETNKIALDKYKLLPGSGVNLQYYEQQEYPAEGEINIVFISRIMKEKGADEFIEAAKVIKSQYIHVHFHICGFCEEAYETTLEELQNDGIIEFHGMVKDVRTILKDMHCLVLPSYHEGMSNVLLEAAAVGRPLIASDIPGCRETFEENIGGFLVEPRNAQELVKRLEKFINLPYEKKKEMGIAARKYVEKHFDRQKVVEAYMNEIISGRTDA